MVAPVLGDHPGLLDLAIVRILCPPPSLNKAGLSGSKFAHHPRKGWVAIPIISIKTSDCNYCIAIAMKQSLQNIFKVSQCSEQTIWPFDVQKRIQIFCCCTSITTIHNQFFSDFGLGSAIHSFENRWGSRIRPESVRSPGWSVPPRPCRRLARRSAIDPGTSPPLIGKPRETLSPMNHYGYYGYLSFHHGSQNIQWKPNSLFIINWLTLKFGWFHTPNHPYDVG